MISIVTICFNESKNIQKTIESINNQSNKNYEHIIKDGLSTDNTIEIVNKFKLANRKIFSYEDKGIYNAFNQALSHCSGDYINFLNAGDSYTNPLVLNLVEDIIVKTNCDIIYGDLKVIKSQNDTEYLFRDWNAGYFDRKKLKYGWMPPHPTVFVKKNIFKKIGNFDENFKISGDYDWLLRVMKIPDLRIEYTSSCTVNMDYGGISQSKYFESFWEDCKISIKNKYLFMPIIKRLAKVGQLQIKIRENLDK
jgi:glycosyltransferase